VLESFSVPLKIKELPKNVAAMVTSFPLTVDVPDGDGAVIVTSVPSLYVTLVSSPFWSNVSNNWLRLRVDEEVTSQVPASTASGGGGNTTPQPAGKTTNGTTNSSPHLIDRGLMRLIQVLPCRWTRESSGLWGQVNVTWSSKRIGPLTRRLNSAYSQPQDRTASAATGIALLILGSGAIIFSHKVA